MSRTSRILRDTLVATPLVLLLIPPITSAQDPGLSADRSQQFAEGRGGLGGDRVSTLDTRLGDHFGAEVAIGDFNCDSLDDLAIGAPNEDSIWVYEGDAEAYGAVTVLYGSIAGVTTAGYQHFGPEPRLRIRFGTALATGDFNNDGCDDLAVGGPSHYTDYISTYFGAGSVTVFQGSRTGLTRSTRFDEDTPGVPGHASLRDAFGTALASGDFNGDSYDDLAIGVPGKDREGGAIRITYGSPSGLVVAATQHWDQDHRAMPGEQENQDRFGESLAVGDFNSDGIDDLAIGVPGENDDAGAVVVMYGSIANLLSDRGAKLFMQGADGMVGSAEGGNESTADRFGAALTTGDFSGDGYDDLAIGVPGEDYGRCDNTGVVHVVFGWSTGLQPGNGNGFHNGFKTGNMIASSLTCSSYLGSALSAADFDHDGFADLVVGSPWRSVGSPPNIKLLAGDVEIMPGSVLGPLGGSARGWTQGGTGAGETENGDFFGSALETGDFDGDGAPDLAIGVPGEDTDIGAVNILYGVAPDGTPPEIASVVSPAPNADGWHNGDVSLSWSVVDPQSEILARASCDPVQVTTDTPGTTYRCAARSEGGEASESVVIRRDSVPPSISTELRPAPNPQGWHGTDVIVHFSCSDALSGLAGCTAERLIDSEGAGIVVEGAAQDIAGNPAYASVTLNIDRSPPIADAGGPYRISEGGQVTFDGAGSSDALSGIKRVRWSLGSWFSNFLKPSLRLDDDMQATVELEVEDWVGQTATATAILEVVNEPPNVQVSASPLTVTVGESLQLVGGYYDPGTADSHSIFWDFGNGDTAESDLRPTYAWQQPGDYEVTLTVTDDDGGIGTASLSVSVSCPDGGCVPPEPRACDVNLDSFVDVNDVRALGGLRNQPVDKATRRHDLDDDGVITVRDARGCVLECDNPRCTPSS